MKAVAIACLLVDAATTYARYAATSKIADITTSSKSNPLHHDYSTTVTGTLMPQRKYANSHPAQRAQQPPCYMYFYDDLEIDLSFVYLHRGFPLQVTDRHIFFWPENTSSNFTIRFDSKQRYFDTSLLSVYCGDLTDILGRNTIEQENAEFVKIGSFPAQPDLLKHAGRVQLQTSGLNKPECRVQVHFPVKRVPQLIELASATDLKISPLSDARSWEITGLETLDSSEMIDIWFDLEYANVDSIAYSYQIVAEVVGCKGFDVAKLEEQRGL